MYMSAGGISGLAAGENRSGRLRRSSVLPPPSLYPGDTGTPRPSLHCALGREGILGISGVRRRPLSTRWKRWGWGDLRISFVCMVFRDKAASVSPPGASEEIVQMLAVGVRRELALRQSGVVMKPRPEAQEGKGESCPGAIVGSGSAVRNLWCQG